MQALVKTVYSGFRVLIWAYTSGRVRFHRVWKIHGVSMGSSKYTHNPYTSRDDPKYVMTPLIPSVNLLSKSS